MKQRPVLFCGGMAPPEVCRDLWESIKGVGSWAANPRVRVVEFKRVMP